ncbi:hypothetical protein GCM10027451_23810 [Geodermatophilus aquaeductus]|uniref:DUF6752 domain-containing protein n=1 Tax=Geodermatophilus aquaeductus TaxID=1564161 RepID=A0A521AE30_9ACTN|nr:DUF6752 domain-containing protein [Geodermatophilus aquaeductus]SMO33074.1 hypothetical protein SAMN06273567_10152 [Geodermatophilus aquaeductus]
MAATATLKALVKTPVKRLRRAFVPEYQDLLAQVGDLQGRLGPLQDLPAEVHRLRERLDDAQARIRELEDGLHEARRLNLRIAELTDVVTEVVLPLHDRDIDPSVFAGLPDDTR